MNVKEESSSIKTNTKKTTKTRILQTIDAKMQIIERFERGESLTMIGRSFGVSRSTIASILQNKDKIKKYVQNRGNTSSKIISARHGRVMAEMERSLSAWIEEQQQNNILMSTSRIQAKALSLHEEWKTRLKDESGGKFLASKGWYDKFRKRFSGNPDVLKPNTLNVNSDEGSVDKDHSMDETFREVPLIEVKPVRSENCPELKIRPEIASMEAFEYQTDDYQEDEPAETDPLTVETLNAIKEYFKRPRDVDDRYYLLGKTVSVKLRHLPKEQMLIAEKLINDVLFHAEMGKLNTSHRLMDTS